MMTNWYQPKAPNEIVPRPWLADDAINFLESILTPDMIVCEFGGGGSTLWLAERVCVVFTEEPDEDWRREIEKLAPDNVNFGMPIYFENDECDLLFIDGEPVTERAKWIKKAHRIALQWVVLDNANRPEYADEREALKASFELVFTSKLQAKHLVTEFWRRIA
jgi:hypothetical protein